jgi:hypothetical protein
LFYKKIRDFFLNTIRPWILLFWITFVLSCTGGWTTEKSGSEDSIAATNPIVIGPPSSSYVKSGPVTFEVTYPLVINTSTITLKAQSIVVHGENQGCQVTQVEGSQRTRFVTIDQCVGTGTVSISIAPHTAKFVSGRSLLGAGPSLNYRVDNTGPIAPSSVSLGAIPENLFETPAILFSGSSDLEGGSISGYEVRIEKVSDSTVVQDWVAHISGESIKELSLLRNTQYRVFVRGLDHFGNKGTSHQGVLWTSSDNPCPLNYVQIPPLSPYTTEEFCVSKYEMKNLNGVAKSQKEGVPWVSIQRGQDYTSAGGAMKACRDLGPQYSLISNAQWQSIARNIENVTANWSDQIVGLGSINTGHTYGAPAYTLAADVDSNSCSGTEKTCSLSSWDRQRRVHFLSTGQVIWDFSGNVWEWLDDNYSSLGITQNIPESWYEFFELGASNQLRFGPTVSTRTTSQGMGLILGGSGGAVIRGGGYHAYNNNGIFAVILNYGVNTSWTNVGFRCVYNPHTE